MLQRACNLLAENMNTEACECSPHSIVNNAAFLGFQFICDMRTVVHLF